MYTPHPHKNLKTPPPKTRNLGGMRFSCREEQKIQGAHSHLRPENCGRNISDYRSFTPYIAIAVLLFLDLGGFLQENLRVFLLAFLQNQGKEGRGAMKNSRRLWRSPKRNPGGLPNFPGKLPNPGGMAFRAPGKSRRNSPAWSKSPGNFSRNEFEQPQTSRVF